MPGKRLAAGQPMFEVDLASHQTSASFAQTNTSAARLVLDEYI